MSLVRAFVVSLVVAGCSVATDPPGSVEPYQPLGDTLKGCNGKASLFVPADGDYVLTTFGGANESQPLACGGSSKSGSWYYAASKQRYGCGAHIQLSANGNCVVAETDDYGPDVCVEKAVGNPVLDASPLVAQALFGTQSLGWSDRRHVTVELVSDTTPLGPCALSDVPGSGGAGGGSGGGSAKACSGDWQCNPGSDGSGLICVGGVCVPGCHQDWQCPGNTTCVSGSCK